MASSNIKAPTGRDNFAPMVISSLSEIVASGTYRINVADTTSASDIPTGLQGKIVFVYQLGRTSGAPIQFIRPYYPSDDSWGLYVRSTNPDSGNFAAWKKITVS